MDKEHFSLGNRERGRIVVLARIFFGAICLALAGIWVVYSLKAGISTGSVWLTVFFLTVFGFYQIWAGAGKAERYIVITGNTIIVKKYIFLPPVEMSANETLLIELHTLKIVFRLRSGKSILLRFGTTYYELNEQIIDKLVTYSERNNLETRVISEEL